MGGFSSITGQDTIVNADNASFDGTERAGVLATNGQLWVGTTAVNAGGTHINVGTITSPNGTLTVGYSSPNITLDLAGGGEAIDSIAMQTGTSPVVPTAGGLVTFNGSKVAAGTNPVRTNGTGANTMQLEVQTAQAIAATDATKIGLANFNSAQFSVDANGFVSATGAIPIQFTEDSGTATPAAGNINFVGALPTTTSSFPVSTTGTGSTVSLRFNNSFPPATIAGGGTANATFTDYNFHYTAGGTLNLPQGGTAGVSNGKSFYVADVGGTAGTTSITINPFAGDTIMGLASYVLNTNYQSVILQWATGNRWIAI